jgi:hypothetical protein
MGRRATASGARATSIASPSGFDGALEASADVARALGEPQTTLELPKPLVIRVE